MLDHNLIMFLAKIMIAFPFLHSAKECTHGFAMTSQLIASRSIPFPQITLIGVICFKIVGGLSLIFGYYVQYASLALAGFTVLATVLFHDFWNREGLERQTEIFWVTTNIGLIGGLLLLANTVHN